MNILKSYYPVFIIILFFGFTSCKKKCILEENVDSGSIIADVVIYPQSGYMTSSMGGDYVIDATHPYADNFEVAINGSTKTAVNYTNYTILACPTASTCFASFNRSVTVDNTAQTVVYKIIVTQCECDETRTVENYVLVPSFPSSYTVSYDVSYVDK